MEQKRRLSDKIIEAHGQACAEDKLEVAEHLIKALEVDLTAFGHGLRDKRQNTEMLEAAYARHAAVKDAKKA